MPASSARCVPPDRSTVRRRSTGRRWKDWWRSTSAPGPRTRAAARTSSSGGRGGAEVDFVVYGAHEFQAFEIKNGGRVHARDVRALRTFREDYPEAETALLYRGRDRLRIDGVWCLPVAEFLREMAPDRGLLAWV